MVDRADLSSEDFKTGTLVVLTESLMGEQFGVGEIVEVQQTPKTNVVPVVWRTGERKGQITTMELGAFKWARPSTDDMQRL
jgi:hypothetical protein